MSSSGASGAAASGTATGSRAANGSSSSSGGRRHNDGAADATSASASAAKRKQSSMLRRLSGALNGVRSLAPGTRRTASALSTAASDSSLAASATAAGSLMRWDDDLVSPSLSDSFDVGDYVSIDDSSKDKLQSSGGLSSSQAPPHLRVRLSAPSAVDVSSTAVAPALMAIQSALTNASGPTPGETMRAAQLARSEHKQLCLDSLALRLESIPGNTWADYSARRLVRRLQNAAKPTEKREKFAFEEPSDKEWGDVILQHREVETRIRIQREKLDELMRVQMGKSLREVMEDSKQTALKHGEMRLKCRRANCEGSFASLEERAKHLLEVHGVDPNRIYTCRCGAGFRTHSQRAEHYQDCAMAPVKSLACPVPECNVCYSSKQAFEQHVRSHEDFPDVHKLWNQWVQASELRKTQLRGVRELIFELFPPINHGKGPLPLDSDKPAAAAAAAASAPSSSATLGAVDGNNDDDDNDACMDADSGENDEERAAREQRRPRFECTFNRRLCSEVVRGRDAYAHHVRWKHLTPGRPVQERVSMHDCQEWCVRPVEHPSECSKEPRPCRLVKGCDLHLNHKGDCAAQPMSSLSYQGVPLPDIFPPEEPLWNEEMLAGLKPDTLVWAKFREYPFWPAKVLEVEPPKEPGNTPGIVVHFFGDNTSEKIRHLETRLRLFRCDNYDKYMKKGALHPQLSGVFATAMEQALALEMEQGGPPKETGGRMEQGGASGGRSRKSRGSRRSKGGDKAAKAERALPKAPRWPPEKLLALRPNQLVWYSFKYFPFWPAKVIAALPNEGGLLPQVTVHFFGDSATELVRGPNSRLRLFRDPEFEQYRAEGLASPHGGALFQQALDEALEHEKRFPLSTVLESSGAGSAAPAAAAGSVVAMQEDDGETKVRKSAATAATVDKPSRQPSKTAKAAKKPSAPSAAAVARKATPAKGSSGRAAKPAAAAAASSAPPPPPKPAPAPPAPEPKLQLSVVGALDIPGLEFAAPGRKNLLYASDGLTARERRKIDFMIASEAGRLEEKSARKRKRPSTSSQQSQDSPAKTSRK